MINFLLIIGELDSENINNPKKGILLSPNMDYFEGEFISEKNMENLDEKVMDELFGELDEENKDKKEKKDEDNDLSSDKKSKKSDEKMDQADLSILEDSEGNLLGKDEIERKLKERMTN